VIGESAPRRRDAELVTGRARYVADLTVPGEAWLRVVRSPLAHARLNGVEADTARALPGVLGVFTADDLPDMRIPIRIEFGATPRAESVLQPPLARDVVRYVGEPVAIVVAEDAYVAEDAAELVALDLEPLDAALDPVAAATEGAPLVHEGLGGNVVETVPIRYGEVEAAFAAADVVVRRRLAVQRHTGVPMETRGLLAEPDGTGRLTLWGAAKVKHFNRGAIAALLSLDPADLRLVEVDVGGGFGVRGEVYPEDVLVPWAALRLGRPVKWIEDRAEHLVATNHAREQVHEVAVAAASDGRLLAFTSTAWIDQGAYVRTQGILPSFVAVHHLPGPYVWDAFAVTAHAVLTNRTPVGTYRGPGMTEASFVRERALDLVAGELGIDPIELRRRNLVPAERMPFVYDLGEQPPIVYESGDFPAFFEQLLAETGAESIRCEPGTGVGVAAFAEMSGIGPFEDASVEAQPDGTFVVRAGVGSLGQGVETALGQIAAEELGVPLDRVTVRFHDTDDVASGFGSFASRSTTVAGNAVALAARELRRRAGELLEAEVGTVDVAAHASELVELGVVTARYDKEHPSYSFGAALAVASVDPETGRARVLRHVVAHDVGRAVNPALVRGQLAGAAAQGIAAALFEELPYDEAGTPLAVSLADYLVPSLAELPEVETIVIEHPVDGSPTGVKGAGEAGMAGTPAAVANAVAAALGPAGAAVDRLPLTPARVRAILRAAESGSTID
jgi:carbon-monoxide dehydrogenase large subunit